MKQRLVDISNNKLIWKLIILIFGILFWSVSIINQKYISDYHDGVSLRYSEPVLSYQEIEGIIEGMVSRNEINIPQVTLWHRDRDTITNEVRNVSLDISLITVAGDMTKIYPHSMLYGGYLTKEDYTGCVIDRNTANKLFKSEDVIGLKLLLKDKEYTIRGILEDIGSNTMIVQEKDSVKYSCMELIYSDTEKARFLAENFVYTYGLGTPLVYKDGYMYQKLSYSLIHIPLWISAIAIIIYFARKVYLMKASPILFIIACLAIIMISTLLIKITNIHIYYPDSMIPNRWSDFEFWTSQWKRVIAFLNGREGNILYYKDMLLRKRMLLVVSGVIMAVLSEVYFLKVSGTVNKL